MVALLEFKAEAEVNVVDQPTNPDFIGPASTISLAAAVYLSIFFTLLVMSFVVMYFRISFLGQKTRAPPQSRVYVGSRARQSLSQTEPTIYVSPANLPPPPKYEHLAPPSYEEVVRIHYPQYQGQPITEPIANAMAHNSAIINITNEVIDSPATSISVTADARTSS